MQAEAQRNKERVRQQDNRMLDILGRNDPPAPNLAAGGGKPASKAAGANVASVQVCEITGRHCRA